MRTIREHQCLLIAGNTLMPILANCCPYSVFKSDPQFVERVPNDVIELASIEMNPIQIGRSHGKNDRLS